MAWVGARANPKENAKWCYPRIVIIKDLHFIKSYVDSNARSLVKEDHFSVARSEHANAELVSGPVIES